MAVLLGDKNNRRLVLLYKTSVESTIAATAVSGKGPSDSPVGLAVMFCGPASQVRLWPHPM